MHSASFQLTLPLLHPPHYLCYVVLCHPNCSSLSLQFRKPCLFLSFLFSFSLSIGHQLAMENNKLTNIIFCVHTYVCHCKNVTKQSMQQKMKTVKIQITITISMLAQKQKQPKKKKSVEKMSSAFLQMSLFRSIHIRAQITDCICV